MNASHTSFVPHLYPVNAEKSFVQRTCDTGENSRSTIHLCDPYWQPNFQVPRLTHDSTDASVDTSAAITSAGFKANPTTQISVPNIASLPPAPLIDPASNIGWANVSD